MLPTDDLACFLNRLGTVADRPSPLQLTGTPNGPLPSNKNMKALLNIPVLILLLVAAPSPCFDLWDVWSGSKKEAKELGFEIRSRPNGATELSVELEIKTEGEFKSFSRVDHPGRVELQIKEGKMSLVSATLKEARSKPGHVVVSFSADRAQLERITLRVWIPGSLGGTIYELRVKEFVQLK